MGTYIIVSNNPMVRGKYPQFACQFCETDEQVMTTSRDLIHKGYLLIMHPLAGSVKPGQTPYRSIILEAHDSLDYQSLHIMEHALGKFAQFKKTAANREFPVRILEDYQAVDCSLIDSAIESLKK